MRLNNRHLSLVVVLLVAFAATSSISAASGPNGSPDRPVFGDWDGNSTTTVGVVRGDANSNNLRWLLRSSNSGGNPDLDILYGDKTSDTPVFGDWDGDNTTTIGVVRPDPNSNNWLWLLRNSNAGGAPDLAISFGNKNTDIPAFGDWDGNNTTTIGVVRPDTGQLRWLLRNSNSGGNPDLTFLYGNAVTNTPVFGDWDGSNTTTVGVTGPDTGSLNIRWQLRNSNSSGLPDLDFLYGNQINHQPVFGDWDGNNTTTVGAYASVAIIGEQSEWLLRNSNSGGSPDLDFFYGGAS